MEISANLTGRHLSDRCLLYHRIVEHMFIDRSTQEQYQADQQIQLNHVLSWVWSVIGTLLLAPVSKKEHLRCFDRMSHNLAGQIFKNTPSPGIMNFNIGVEELFSPINSICFIFFIRLIYILLTITSSTVYRAMELKYSFVYENPLNSSWFMDFNTSGLTGVNIGSSFRKSISKLLTSRAFFLIWFLIMDRHWQCINLVF